MVIIFHENECFEWISISIYSHFHFHCCQWDFSNRRTFILCAIHMIPWLIRWEFKYVIEWIIWSKIIFRLTISYKTRLQCHWFTKIIQHLSCFLHKSHTQANYFIKNIMVFICKSINKRYEIYTFFRLQMTYF